jgi:DNA repair photolyase
LSKQVIYETRGRAREFCELAINLYSGCTHACIYCYGADVTHQDKAKFRTQVVPRVTEEDICASANKLHLSGEKRRVLLCFVTDPYQPLEMETKLTRNAITILHENGLNVVILTKGGERSERDFDLLGPGDAYATTLTLLTGKETLYWEPGAAPPWQRIECLKEAHRRGIETWVSFEPVIYPDHTLKLMYDTREFVGHYKVGTMNYHPQGKNVDWMEFGWGIKREMDRLGVHYYFKKDLLREMRVKPGEFQQTWICG